MSSRLSSSTPANSPTRLPSSSVNPTVSRWACLTSLGRCFWASLSVIIFTALLLPESCQPFIRVGLCDHSVDNHSFCCLLDLVEYAVSADPQPIRWEDTGAQSLDPRFALQRGVDRENTMALIDDLCHVRCAQHAKLPYRLRRELDSIGHSSLAWPP